MFYFLILDCFIYFIGISTNTWRGQNMSPKSNEIADSPPGWLHQHLPDRVLYHSLLLHQVSERGKGGGSATVTGRKRWLFGRYDIFRRRGSFSSQLLLSLELWIR